MYDCESTPSAMWSVLYMMHIKVGLGSLHPDACSAFYVALLQDVKAVTYAFFEHNVIDLVTVC